MDSESPRSSVMLSQGGSAPKPVPPVPKAPPKFAYPQPPTHMRPVSNAISLEDEDEPKAAAGPAVPKRPTRKRSMSTGDETEVDAWRAQNNITPQPQATGRMAPQPPKKPLYGVYVALKRPVKYANSLLVPWSI